MKKRLWAALCVAAGLGVSGQAWAWKDAIPLAAPYVDKALSQPFETLRTTAYNDLNAYNAFTLGLALYAGRGTDGDFSAADEVALNALDARITPDVEAYLKRHPENDHGRINWRKKLKATPDEISLIGRYQAAYLPEFWLGWAMSQTKQSRLITFARMRSADFYNGGQAGGLQLQVTRKTLIEWRIYTTATQCIRAVRNAAGYSIAPLRDYPLSIRLMRNHIKYDVEYRVTEDLKPDGRYKGLKGAAACGTPAQFDVYVAKLKAAD